MSLSAPDQAWLLGVVKIPAAGRVSQHKQQAHYLDRVEGGHLSGLFPVTVLLKLNLAGLLDEVTNMAAAGGQAIGTAVTGDVVTVTGIASLDRLCGG